MTKNIRHEERIEEIQRRCCMLLEKGKGWDYIGAMCQLMANKESVFMKQGLTAEDAAENLKELAGRIQDLF